VNDLIKVVEMKLLGMSMESEKVPKGKQYMISTRENSEYKWQNERGIIGALEVPSQPGLNLQEEYIQRTIEGKKEAFAAALRVWEDWKLRDEFIRACENVPKETCCCGLVPDDDSTMKSMIPALNKGWMKAVNERLSKDGKDFHLDSFVWNWHNAVGKSETNVLMIRFYEGNVEPSSWGLNHDR
jgi:hypothetical protein